MKDRLHKTDWNCNDTDYLNNSTTAELQAIINKFFFYGK